MNSCKRPTIQMIAERAGVSRGTVDRVLNNRSYVSADARERILSVMEELGYVPKENRHNTGAFHGSGAAYDHGAVPASVRVMKLGVLLPNFGGQFTSDVDNGIAMAAEDLKYSNTEVIVKRCRTDLPRETVTLLDELVAEGAEGISICALNDNTIQKRVSELVQAGIPCVTFNNDLAESGRLCFIGPDIHREGRVAAELMSKCVDPDARILATVGNLKFDGHFQRLSGFLERMTELGFSGDQIMTEETFNDYTVTYRVVREAIDQHSDLSGVYMANLSVAGCVEAIKSMDVPHRIHVVCHDINESIKQMLLDGSVDFTIPQDMVQQSYAPLMILREYLQRGTLPGPSRASGQIRILCAENLGDV